MNQKDIKLLWGRAGNRCAVCRAELSNDITSKDASYLLGEQAHIIGEKDDAPRGKSTLSLDERNTYHNLILLCPTHHTEIDKSVTDLPIEKLYQAKSKHELWVKESLSSTVDIKARANELIVSSVVDSVATLCRLETWSSWTSFALSPTPSWPIGLDKSIYELVQKLIGVIWPSEFDELRRSSITLARLSHQASEKFHEHAEQKGDAWVTIRFYSQGGYNPNYAADLKRYEDWLEECHSLINEATKAANWFADVVRRDINPVFFAENGRFIVETGPYIDGTFRTALLQFTETEKSTLPGSILGKQKNGE